MMERFLQTYFERPHQELMNFQQLRVHTDYFFNIMRNVENIHEMIDFAIAQNRNRECRIWISFGIILALPPNIRLGHVHENYIHIFNHQLSLYC